jgi:hypothetical protein
MTPLLRLGAFDVALDDCAVRYQSLLAGLFRVQVEPLDDRGGATLRLALGVAQGGSVFGPDDALRSVEEDGRITWKSDVVAGRFDFGTPCRLDLRVNVGHARARHLDHYLRIVLNAVLRRLGRMRLHAAAVDHAGSASLFVGDKGAGKTTICLHLARSGATVLGEDQIMVRRTPEGAFLAAGGDDLMRLTAKTEAHFFERPLDLPLVEVGGVRKKEIRARDHIAYLPNLERPLRRLFFPSIGGSFEIRPMGRREAVGRLAAPLLPVHRFASDRDRLDFLAFLAGLAEQVECFALTLTPDLADLRKLSEFLE